MAATYSGSFSKILSINLFACSKLSLYISITANLFNAGINSSTSFKISSNLFLALLNSPTSNKSEAFLNSFLKNRWLLLLIFHCFPLKRCLLGDVRNNNQIADQYLKNLSFYLYFFCNSG